MSHLWVIIDFLTYFSKICNFLINDPMNKNGYDSWIGMHFI